MDLRAEILACSSAWDTALLANDAQAFATFVTDDWVYVGPTGPTSRADLLSWIEAGRLVHHTMRTVGKPRVVVHGDAAIVTAHKTSSGTWDGSAYEADEWISEVYTRDDGRWRCVLSQKCPTAT